MNPHIPQAATPGPSTSELVNEFRRLLGSNLDQKRKNFKMFVLLCALHMVLLIVGHMVYMTINNHTGGGYAMFFFPNSIWGLFMVTTLAIAIWTRGGILLDALVSAGLLGHDMALGILRILLGFITVETLINCCFAIFPGDLKWTIALISSLPAYFLVRLMAGKKIDWNNWVNLPLINIVICLASIYYKWWSLKDPSFSDPSFWLFLSGLTFLLVRLHPFFTIRKALAIAGISLALELGGLSLMWVMRPVETENANALRARSKQELQKELKDAEKEPNIDSAIARRNQAIRKEREQELKLDMDPQDYTQPTMYDPTNFRQRNGSFMTTLATLSVIILLVAAVLVPFAGKLTRKTTTGGGTHGH